MVYDKVGERIFGPRVVADELPQPEVDPAGPIVVAGVYQLSGKETVLLRLSGGELALVRPPTLGYRFEAGEFCQATVEALQQGTLLVSCRGPKLPPVVLAGRRPVYIGRPGSGERAGFWGNPFRTAPGTPRGSTIALYEQLVRADFVMRSAIEGLRGQVLECFCVPRHCHGEALLKILAETAPE